MKQILHWDQSNVEGFCSILGSDGPFTASRFDLDPAKGFTFPLRETPWSVAGSFSNWKIVMKIAPGSGVSITFTLYVNQTATALTITIAGASTTGSDTTHTVSISPGDTVYVRSAVTGSPAIPPSFPWMILSLEFDSGDNFQSGYCTNRPLGFEASVMSTGLCWGQYLTSGSLAFRSVTDANVDDVIPIAGVIDRLDLTNTMTVTIGGYDPLQSGDSLEFAIVKNNIVQDGSGGTPDTRTTFAYPTTSAVWTGTLNIAAGDIVRLQVTVGALGGRGTYFGWSYRFNSTTAHRFILGKGFAFYGRTDVPSYQQPSGWSAGGTNEAGAKGYGGISTWYLISLSARGPTGPGSVHVDSRLNGVTQAAPSVTLGTTLVPNVFLGYSTSKPFGIFAVASAVSPGGSAMTITSSDDWTLETTALDVPASIRAGISIGHKPKVTASRAILLSTDIDQYILADEDTIELKAGTIRFSGTTITGIPTATEDPRATTHQLGGSRSVALISSSYVEVIDWIDFVPATGEFEGATVTAQVEVRTANAGTSVTPKIRNVTDSTDAVTGSACTATNADYSGTQQRQSLSFTPVAGKRYRLMITGSNTTNSIYGIGQIKVVWP